MTVHQLIQQFALHANLPTFALDAQGCARLMADEKFAVQFEHDESARCLHLYSVLGKLPAEGRETLFAQLLQANLFGADTAGATLAIDAEHGEIVLCDRVDLDDANVDADQLVRRVERVLSQSEHWIERLAGSALTSAPSIPMAPPVTAPPPLGSFA